MTPSEILFKNGRAVLSVNGKEKAPLAYITYFDERTCCADFAKAGYRLFSLCASFSGMPLNSSTGFSPLFGIFDIKGKPDYSRFDANVRTILAAAPDAAIFPRVRISMPQWWVEENPTEVCRTADGNQREALYSKKYREDGAALLREFIAHVHASDYAESIIGYQLAGGDTEEWFHFDRNGSFSGCTKQCFNEYIGDPNGTLEPPDRSFIDTEGLITDPLVQKYLEFLSFESAKTVAYFAAVAKECVQRKQIIGAFYGYCSPNVLRGTIGASLLLRCPDIDFFCSPAAYAKQRALGIDWAEPCAGESIKQHRKLYFIENDIRTCFSKIPEECRPGVDPQKKYNSPVWIGPPTLQQSVWAVRKSFARQYTHANAMWWFDMWGGWYACEELMTELQEYRKLEEKFLKAEISATRSHLAVLFDEKCAFRVGQHHPMKDSSQLVRDAMGNTGIPFDALLTEDYAECLHYDAVLFPYPAEFDSREIKKIKSFLDDHHIPYAQITKETMNTDALRELLTDLGVHCYCTSGDVIYCGNGMLAIHAATAGEKIIRLPEKSRCTELFGNLQQQTETLIFQCEQFETKLFMIDKA